MATGVIKTVHEIMYLLTPLILELGKLSANTLGVDDTVISNTTDTPPRIGIKSHATKTKPSLGDMGK